MAEEAQLVEDRLAAAANAAKEVPAAEGAAGEVTSEVEAQEAETLSVLEAQIAQQKASVPAGETLDPDSRLAKQIAVAEKRRDELLEKREARKPEAKKVAAKAKREERKAKAKLKAEEEKAKVEARKEKRRAKAKQTRERKAAEAKKAAGEPSAEPGADTTGRAAEEKGAPPTAKPGKRGKAAKVEPAPGPKAGEAGGAGLETGRPAADQAPAAEPEAPGGAAERPAPGRGAAKPPTFKEFVESKGFQVEKGSITPKPGTAPRSNEDLAEEHQALLKSLKAAKAPTKPAATTSAQGAAPVLQRISSELKLGGPLGIRMGKTGGRPTPKMLTSAKFPVLRNIAGQLQEEVTQRGLPEVESKNRFFKTKVQAAAYIDELITTLEATPAKPEIKGTTEQQALAEKAEKEATRREKIRVTQAKRHERERTPDPTVDDLKTAVAKFAPINRAEAEAEGLIDPGEPSPKVGIRAVFTRNGISLEAAAQNLEALGYPVTGKVRSAEGQIAASGSVLMENLEKSLRGDAVFSNQAGDQVFAAEMEARIADEQARREDEALAATESPADPADDPLPGDALLEEEIPSNFDPARRRMGELADELNQLKKGAGTALVKKADADDLFDIEIVQALEEAINEQGSKRRTGVAGGKRKKGPRTKKKAAAKPRIEGRLPEGEVARQEKADIASVRERLTQRATGKTPFPVPESVKERAGHRLEVFDSIFEHPDGAAGVEFHHRNSKGRLAIVTPDTIEPGNWRVTFFDKDGFSGHATFDTAPDAVFGAMVDGFDLRAPPGTLDSIFRTPAFQEGLKVTEEIRKLNEASFKRSQKPAAAEPQEGLAPAATTAEQVAGRAREVQERLAPKKEPDVTAGPLFDLAERKDFEKKQGDLFAPVSVSDAERLGKNPKEKKALREDARARAEGTRKPRTDLAGDPVEAHEWSKDTQIDSVAYTLEVNDRRTPKAIVLHEALTRARKYTNNAISNLAHETFNIPFKQSRRALTQALSDLIDGGMPEGWVDGIRKFVADPQTTDSTAVGQYIPESRTIAMRVDILDDTANIPLETQIGLPAPPISAGTIRRNQRSLTNMLAHELAHSIDFAGRGQRMNRRANSWASPLFTVDITSMDFKTTAKGKRVLDVPEHSMGPALHELYTIFDQNIAGLREYFKYPFSELPLLVRGMGLTQMENVRTGQLIKHEGFAQGAALYFTHRATIEKNAPTFAQLMKEIVDGTPRTESARKRDVRLHGAFQRTPAARDSKVDQLEPVDQTAPASHQVRKEAARVQNIRQPRVEAQVPARDAEREYTPGQVAITEKGGFGKLPPFNLRQKVKDFIAGARKLNYGTLRQLILDQYNSFDDILGDPIAHMKATLSAGANSLMDAIVLYGIPRMDDSGAVLVGTRLVVVGTDSQGREVRKVVRLKGRGKEGFEKGVAEVLEPLGLEVQDWFQWMVGNRASRLLAEDREKLFDGPDDITNLLSFADGTLPSDPTPGSRLRLYQEVRAEFEEINNAIVDIGVQLGTIRAEDAATWADEGFYIPFYRMLADQNNKKGNAGPNTDVALVRQNAIEHLKGAKEQLADPLQNALLNWHHILGSSLRNAAGARALESAMNMGIVTRLSLTKEEIAEAEAAGEEVPGISEFTKKRKDVVWVREEGEKVFYQFNDPEVSGLTKEDHARVLTSLEGLSYEGLNNKTMRAMRFMKRQLTGIVVVNPNFKIANGFRDMFQALAVAGLSFNPIKNFLRGWKATSATSATNIAGLSTAGFFEQTGYVHGSDPEAVRRLESRGVKRSSILDFTNPRVLLDLFKRYQDFGVRIENVQRAAVFETDLQRGKSLLEAAFNARDLLDFSRHGSAVAVRILGQTVPFFQARLQGLDRFGRAAFDPNQQRQFFTVVGAYSFASVALYAWMHDDEDFKNTEQWERDTYHIFKIPGSDLLFRIPRPFEVGVIATMAERFAEQIVDKDAHAELFWDRIKFAFGQTFAFNPVPQAALPVWELWGNRNTFTGRPIESVSMRNLKIEDRRRLYTTETSVLLSKGYNSIVWEDVEMSPVQIEHLVQGYWGWLGNMVLGTTDMLLTRPAFGEPPKPALQLQDMPFVGRWVREAPQRHTGPSEVYFKMLKDAQQTFNSIQKARRDGDAGRRQAIFQENKALLSQRRQLTRAQRRVGKINDRIQRVTRSTTLSADQKRSQINALRRRTQAIQGRAVQRARSRGVQ
ncbi:MAG: LPD38 domain-containing protein [Nannocystaceae bacterium]